MKAILRNYYVLVLIALFIGLFGRIAAADELRVQYHCTSDKPLLYRTAEGSLPTGTELRHSPELGKSLNLTIGRFPSQYMIWIRRPWGENNRFASVFEGTKLLTQQLDLGQNGQRSTAVFPFQVKDGDELITGSCEITLE